MANNIETIMPAIINPNEMINAGSNSANIR